MVSKDPTELGIALKCKRNIERGNKIQDIEKKVLNLEKYIGS